MSFEPRGKVAVLLAAMRAQPEQIVWPADQVAATMEVVQKNLPAYLQAVITRQMLHRQIENGKSFFSLQPFGEVAAAPTPAPIATRPAFVPPQMTPPRGAVGNVPRAPLPAPISTRAAEPLPPPSAPAPIRTRPEPQPEQPAPEDETEVVEFNAALRLDGDLVLYGLTELEDGGHMIAGENLAKLRKLLAWMPC
jgi:hypothetical protein